MGLKWVKVKPMMAKSNLLLRARKMENTLLKRVLCSLMGSAGKSIVKRTLRIKRYTKELGVEVSFMDMLGAFLTLAKFTKATSSTTNFVVKELTSSKMETSTLETGGITNKMVSVLPSTKMVPDMKENGFKEVGMAKDVLGTPTVK